MKVRQIKRRGYLKRGFGWGKRCREYDPCCILCTAWNFYDTHKRWPTFNEANDISIANMESKT